MVGDLVASITEDASHAGDDDEIKKRAEKQFGPAPLDLRPDCVPRDPGEATCFPLLAGKQLHLNDGGKMLFEKANHLSRLLLHRIGSATQPIVKPAAHQDKNRD